MVHKSIMDECESYFISTTDMAEAQGLLEPNV